MALDDIAIKEKNKSIVAKIYEFRLAVQGKNPSISGNIHNSIISFLEYPSDLSKATKNDLLKIKGLRRDAADYVKRILSGEEIDSVVNSVPENLPVFDRTRKGYYSPKERAFKQDTLF